MNYWLEVFIEEHELYWLGNIICWFDWRLRPVRCFFIGHHIMSGCRETYEPDYCDKCFRDEDMADIREEDGHYTLPTLWHMLEDAAIDLYWHLRDD